MRISVLGAGAWGTALAVQASRAGHEVCLWGRDAAAIEAMRASRRNAAYLPDSELPAALALTADRAAAVAHAAGGLTIVATPMSGLRETLAALPVTHRTLWLCKGFEAGSGRLGHEIARELQPSMAVGVLSGPSFAQEVAAGRPTALVAASENDELAHAAVEAFHGERLRIYTSCDPVGVEVGGAVKNVLAIAVGVCDGLSDAAPDAPGLNARAALITRGLAEMMRLGLALGARAETFMGLSGLGDLVLTATGDLSRNRRVGLLLAQGRALPQILQQLGHVAEGVYSAPTVLARARAAGVEMPITEAMVALLDGRVTATQVVELLMSRDARPE
ncbi:NAD(P)H-dependent glycerol-3-phosphate dehydrogenase [Roseateles cellulosilyticus]|uniref:Glycerol-3-phosphate dehydrogenase [NAD(P)+] n=1 Tax=Pelomonas cellulosilytica TaxID=2906762 RepID=A0ABS8XWC7_9BURK|nr:NAD(P)H-dependent glycerol-3-phosphate dehydrogenase [Pelomonas sp. P8]MCE4554931.1 NAD(P)-dependent glycerol-3-phosphate dehydrogenase [Pelomonas sp. P8]